MPIRTYRIFYHLQDRSLLLVWLQLVPRVLQVARVALLVALLEVLPLGMALDIVTVVEEPPDLDMVLSILEEGQVTMDQTGVTVVHPLDLVVTVEAMVAVDLVDTVGLQVVSTLLRRIVTHQVVGILRDRKIASHQVGHQVVTLLRELLVAILLLDLVDRHIQDLEVLLVLDLVAHLVLDLAAHLVLDLVAHPIPEQEALLDPVLQVRGARLELLDLLKQFNLVHPPLGPTQHHLHPLQMDLHHLPLLQAQRILPHPQLTLFHHQTILLQLPLPSLGQQAPHPHILAHLVLPHLTTLPLTLHMDHQPVHTATLPPLDNQGTQVILHTQHLDIRQEVPLLVTHLVVLLQVQEAMVDLNRDLEDIVGLQDMVDHLVMEVLLDMELPLDMEHPLGMEHPPGMEHLQDMEHPLGMVALLGMAVLRGMVVLQGMVDLRDMEALLGMVDLLGMAPLGIAGHHLDMVDPHPDMDLHLGMVVLQDMVHQDKEDILPTATKVDLEDTLDLPVATHHTDPLVDLVVLWVLHHQEATPHMIKVDMVHLLREVPQQHLNVCRKNENAVCCAYFTVKCQP